MLRDMQTVTPKRGIKCIHVETPLGIVNIWIDLTDAKGRKVETVEMIPNHYSGESDVQVVGRRFVQREKSMTR